MGRTYSIVKERRPSKTHKTFEKTISSQISKKFN